MWLLTLIGVIHSMVSERDVGLPGGSRLGRVWVIMSGEAGNTHTGLEIGRALRLAREKRGLSLQQVEEVTKIRTRYLRDLENENFDVLPAVYMLGSLKTYAGHLGLDGAAMAAELKRRQRPPRAEQDEAREVPPAREPHGILASLGSLFGIETAEDEAGMVAGPVRSTGLYVGLAVVLIVVFATYLAPSFGEEGRPSVSQVREPKVSPSPSMLARASDVLVDEPYTEGGNVAYQSEKQAHIHTREAAGDEIAEAPADEQVNDQAAGDEIAEAPADEQVNDPPETAQAPPSSTTSFESGPVGAAANALVNASANASPASTPAPTRARPEPAPREEPADDPGNVVSTPAARGQGSLRISDVASVGTPRLGNTIPEQAHQQVQESRNLRIVTSQEISRGTTVQKRQLYQH
jgi:transcriptional regulator with XRE-family HTH domain